MNTRIAAPIDIFGVCTWTTERARLNQWREIVSQANKLGKIYPAYPVVYLQELVKVGLLSPSSASYFLIGDVSLSQIVFLDKFVQFWKDSIDSHTFYYPNLLLSKWKRKNLAVPVASMFLSPSVELDSDLLNTDLTE